MTENERAQVIILLEALREIANYSSKGVGEGICPYGCDTPSIAAKALFEYSMLLEERTDG